MTGRSLRAAINAKCKSCIHDPGARGNWRQQVSGCSSANCPLHPFRPLSGALKRQGRSGVPRGGGGGISRLHGSKSGLPARALGEGGVE